MASSASHSHACRCAVHPSRHPLQDGEAPGDYEPEGSVTFGSDEISVLAASGLRDALLAGEGFTDGDIAQTNAGLMNRELERSDWLTAGQAPDAALLDGLDEHSGPSGRWDQFEVNAKKFNVKSTYNGACQSCA